MEKEITPETIMRLGLGFWESKTLLSAIELGLFTELSKGPATLAAIQDRLGLHPRSSRDFLDALVALRMLERTGTEYSNTPKRICSLIVQNRPTSAAFLKCAMKDFMRSGTTLLKLQNPSPFGSDARNPFIICWNCASGRYVFRLHIASESSTLLTTYVWSSTAQKVQ